MEENGKIKILLADDHRIMRDGLKALFKQQSTMKIVGETEAGESTGQVAQQVKPDVIAIGINIDGNDGIDTVRNLAKQFPMVRIVAYSTYIEKAFISEMLQAGISAYVHLEHDFNELLKAIKAALHGQMYLCPKVAGIVMNSYLKGFAHKRNSETELSLTQREREILRLLSNGLSSKEVALELHISTKTVDTHRRQIMNKLHLYSVAELTKYAIRCGLTSIN